MQPKQGFLSFIRRAVGQKQTLQQLQVLQQQHQLQQQQYWQQQQQLLALGNSLKYLSTAPAEVKSTITYQRCGKIIPCFHPWMLKVRSIHGSERTSTAGM